MQRRKKAAPEPGGQKVVTMKTNTRNRLAAEGGALPIGDLPLFRWADMNSAMHCKRPLTFAVALLAHRYRIPVHLARAVAECAGYPGEAADA